MKNRITHRIVHTFGLIFTTIIFWLVVYYVARGLVYLLDLLRNLDGSIIQGLIIEIVAPGFSIYVSFKLSKDLFTESWKKIGVVLSVLFFFILYFCFGDYIKPIYENIKSYTILFKVGFIISIILGTVISYLEIKEDA